MFAICPKRKIVSAIDQKTVIEIQYCPSLAWYIKAKQRGIIYIDRHEHYNKRSFRNKMTLLSPNGLEMASIPLKKGKHGGKQITDVEIVYSEDWQKLHLRLIQASYGQAPFYEHYMPILEPLFRKAERYLFDYTLSIIRKIDEILHLAIEYRFTEDFHAQSNAHYDVLRDEISQKKDVTFIEKHNLKKYEHPYGHLISEEEFMKLSILDLLFYYGPESSHVLKQYYDEGSI